MAEGKWISYLRVSTGRQGRSGLDLEHSPSRHDAGDWVTQDTLARPPGTARREADLGAGSDWRQQGADQLGQPR
jgi:hypothetical protein